MPIKLPEELRKPTESALALGPLAFALSIPLWLFIPLLLLAVGFGLFLVISALPFIIAALVFGIFYWLFTKAGMPDPYRWVLPMGFGLVALIPAFVPGLRAFVLGTINAQAQAMGFIGAVTEWVVGPILFVTALVILAFIFLFLSTIRQLGYPGAFVAGFLGLALGVAIALNAVGLGPVGARIAIGAEVFEMPSLALILAFSIGGLILWVSTKSERWLR